MSRAEKYESSCSLVAGIKYDMLVLHVSYVSREHSYNVRISLSGGGGVSDGVTPRP